MCIRDRLSFPFSRYFKHVRHFAFEASTISSIYTDSQFSHDPVQEYLRRCFVIIVRICLYLLRIHNLWTMNGERISENGTLNANKITVVLGAQWGDEGKGKVVDLLAKDADLVCRCQVNDTYF